MHTMNFSSVRLSICIPTLNRGAFIKDTLESIASQLTDEVEIVLVDGGSQDNTKEVVTKFQETLPSLRYIRMTGPNDRVAPSCAGFDRDCDLAVAHAKGEYCWLFTDDDLLKPGAIKRVLEAASHDYQLIVINAEVRSPDMSEVLEPSRLMLNKDRVYGRSEWDSLFSSTATYLSFVGGVVIKRRLWLARNKQPYLGTGFIHIGVIFQAPLTGNTLVISEPLIEIRYGDALYMRTSRYFLIWMFTWPDLVWSLTTVSEGSKAAVCPREPWRKFRTLLHLRANGAYSIEEYRNWLSERFGPGWKHRIAKLIAKSPGSILNCLAIIRFYLSRRLPRMCLVNLRKSPFYFARHLGSIYHSSNMVRPYEPTVDTSKALEVTHDRQK